MVHSVPGLHHSADSKDFSARPCFCGDPEEFGLFGEDTLVVYILVEEASSRLNHDH